MENIEERRSGPIKHMMGLLSIMIKDWDNSTGLKKAIDEVLESWGQKKDEFEFTRPYAIKIVELIEEIVKKEKAVPKLSSK